MAETIHLALKANGTDIKGQSTQTSLERADTIECVSFEYGVVTAREAGSGIATGRRQHMPLVIKKRIDSASPLIIKALCENQVIEGVFKFYRPAQIGDGTTEQFYTVAIKKGRVNSVKQHVEHSKQAGQSPDVPMEEVSFVFHTITWTFEEGGVTHEDTWDKQS